MNHPLIQSRWRLSRCVVLALVGLAGLFTNLVRAEETAGAWHTSVNTGVGASSEAVEIRREPSKGSKSHSAQVPARSRGVTATRNGATLPVPSVTQNPRNPGIETSSVDAVNAVPGPAPAAPPAASSAATSLLDMSSTTGRFCVSIKPQVEEMRIVFQKKTLAEIEAELDKRLKLLEEKITDYKQWLQRRQDFSSKAQDALVKIYTKMRPDAAAQQLASAETETAAAVLLKLDPRVASAILNDMDPKLAATLAAVITGAAQTKDEASKPAVATP